MLNQSQQETLKSYIAYEYKECCTFLGLTLGRIDLRLSSSGNIVGEAEIEGGKRPIPTFAPVSHPIIRARILNNLLPMVENKYDDMEAVC